MTNVNASSGVLTREVLDRGFESAYIHDTDLWAWWRWHDMPPRPIPADVAC